MSEKDDNFLAHYGRKGMKWGKNLFGDEPLTNYTRINRMTDGGMGGRNFKSPYKTGINTTAVSGARSNTWGVITPEQRAGTAKQETKKASGGGKGKGGGTSKSSSSSGGGTSKSSNNDIPQSLADINLDGVDPKDMPMLIQSVIDLVIREKINNFSLTDEQVERVGNYILNYRKKLREQFQA